MPHLMDILEKAPGLSRPGWILLSLFAATLIIDCFLSRKYSAGDGSRDENTSQLLVLSLGFNIIVMVCSSFSGLGRLSTTPDFLVPLGLIMALAGVILRYTSIFSLGDRFTWRVEILDQHSLKEDGLYAWIRHPSYLGGLLGLYGAALTYESSISLLVLSCTHLPLIIYRITVEEKALSQYFGELFDGYRARTYRLVPYLF